MEDSDQEAASIDQKDARIFAAAEFTRYSVQMFEHYTKKIGRNDSLAIVIEALSESLGNMISLVREDCQQEVVEQSAALIQQGLLSQQELIAEISYGCIGHA